MRTKQGLMMLVLIFCAGTVLAQSAPLPPQVAISPPRVEVEMERGSAQASVRLFNMGDKSLNVAVSVSDWFLDEDNKLQLVSPDDDSIAKSLLLNPSRFAVEPGESQAVRFAVRPRSKPRDGEHRMMLFLNEQPDETNTENRFVFEFQVPVYILSGDVQREGELYGVNASFADGKLDLGFDVSSEGNASVRLEGNYQVRRIDDDVPRLREASFVAAMGDGVMLEGSLPYLPVFAGTRRTLHTTTELPLAPGRYVVKAQGTLSGTPVSASSEFIVD